MVVAKNLIAIEATCCMLFGTGTPKMEIRDKVHSHEESAEFWMILAGKMECKIGALPIFIADQGDIVYTPKQTWHRARFAGTKVAYRLAMNGYQDLLSTEELQGK